MGATQGSGNIGNTELTRTSSSVTVGTRVSPRPPRRSRRALLTHRAPPLGSGVKAVTGQWM